MSGIARKPRHDTSRRIHQNTCHQHFKPRFGRQYDARNDSTLSTGSPRRATRETSGCSSNSTGCLAGSEDTRSLGLRAVTRARSSNESRTTTPSTRRSGRTQSVITNRCPESVRTTWTLRVSDECVDRQAVRTVSSARTISGSVGSRSGSSPRKSGSKNTSKRVPDRIDREITPVGSPDDGETAALAQSPQASFGVRFV